MTPAPTAAAPTNQCPTLAEAAFLLALTEGFATRSDHFLDWSTQLGKVEQNPVVLFDDDWPLDVTLVVARILVVHDEMRELDRPASADAVYDEMGEILDLQASALNLFIESLDTFDTATLVKAVANRDEAIARSTAFTVVIEGFCER